MDFYVGRPCENFRRIQSYTILECKKRGHWRPFEIQLCGVAGVRAHMAHRANPACRSHATYTMVRGGS